jgi:hypothetical protein
MEMYMFTTPVILELSPIAISFDVMMVQVSAKEAVVTEAPALATQVIGYGKFLPLAVMVDPEYTATS